MPGPSTWAVVPKAVMRCIRGTGKSEYALHFCLTTVHAQDPTFTVKFLKVLTGALVNARANGGGKTSAEGTTKVYGYVESGLLHPLVETQLGHVYKGRVFHRQDSDGEHRRESTH